MLGCNCMCLPIDIDLIDITTASKQAFTYVYTLILVCIFSCIDAFLQMHLQTHIHMHIDINIISRYRYTVLRIFMHIYTSVLSYTYIPGHI